jgi:hypothetical protein
MPQLPSGKHAGIDPEPFFQLIKDAEEGKFVHRLMAIADVTHLLPYLEVIELTPCVGHSGVSFSEDSNPRPVEFDKIATGVTLNHLEQLTGLWTPDDLAAFRAFIDEERNLHYRMSLLEVAIQTQKAIAKSGAFLPKLLAHWWLAGVHPAQEEGWDDDDSPDWDDYDLFVALSTIATGIDEGQVRDASGHNAVMMTKAFLGIVIQETEQLVSHLKGLTADGVREIASELRELRAFENAPAKTRNWIHAQGRENAKALCSSFDGAVLREIDRVAADILALSFVSPDD